VEGVKTRDSIGGCTSRDLGLNEREEEEGMRGLLVRKVCV